MVRGIQPGQALAAAAGATYKRVALSLAKDGQEVTLNDRKFRVLGGMLVYWHQSGAGTWHGLKDPEILKTVRSDQAPQWMPERCCQAESCSGGADIAAVVMVIPPQGIAVVTSGYKGRRGWNLFIVDSNGQVVFDGPPADWRARFAQAETL